jgi:hypothetical protein
MSLFLIFDVNNKRDDVLEAADIDDGDDAKKKSINNWDNTFEAMEVDGDDSDTNEATPFNKFDFFQDFVIDLPFCLSVAIIFFGVDVFVFVMVYSIRDYWK